MNEKTQLDRIEAKLDQLLAKGGTRSTSSAGSTGGGLTFPPYGRAKGQPVHGASMNDLKFYKGGCERTLADESKSRWHAKEQALLDAINAEIARQEGDVPDDDPYNESANNPPPDDAF